MSLAPASVDLFGVVAGVGLLSQPLDEIVVDGLARLGWSVGSLGHGPSSFRQSGPKGHGVDDQLVTFVR